ncbi:hypothetical protein L596_005366 [Steinernema carpocapsae]|uniref:Uncharacterized protein n=1 Tax=Steinernema carpocapsae TaxID=34508 RepID=A0A4V6I8P3_STECR|nr:hypothetical protein L596_005366 [Steinernema carpocapsae]
MRSAEPIFQLHVARREANEGEVEGVDAHRQCDALFLGVRNASWSPDEQCSILWNRKTPMCDHILPSDKFGVVHHSGETEFHKTEVAHKASKNVFCYQVALVSGCGRKRRPLSNSGDSRLASWSIFKPPFPEVPVPEMSYDQKRLSVPEALLRSVSNRKTWKVFHSKVSLFFTAAAKHPIKLGLDGLRDLFPELTNKSSFIGAARNRSPRNQLLLGAHELMTAPLGTLLEYKHHFGFEKRVLECDVPRFRIGGPRGALSQHADWPV